MTENVSISPSDRLRYRLMGSGDADLLFEIDQDPEVMRYLSDGIPTSREEIDDYFVPRIMAFTDPVTGCGLWEMADKESGEYLGWILVRPYGFDTSYFEPDIIELGWRLKRQYWGKGMTTEAAQAIIEALKSNPAIKNFCAIVDPENIGSVRVCEKLGMQFIDKRVHHTPKKDMPVDYYEMPAR